MVRLRGHKRLAKVPGDIWGHDKMHQVRWRLRRAFAQVLVGIGIAAAATLSAGPALSADPHADSADVEGLECRLAFESNRESQFTGPLKPDYLYMLLQAPRANAGGIDSVLQFVPNQAEPEYMIDPVLGKTSASPDVLQFVTSIEAVEEPFSFRIERKSLALSTRQNRIPNYAVGDYVSAIFKTQPKWPEVEGDVTALVKEPIPSATFDGGQLYVMVFGCRHVDPQKLRSAARDRYQRMH